MRIFHKIKDFFEDHELLGIWLILITVSGIILAIMLNYHFKYYTETSPMICTVEAVNYEVTHHPVIIGKIVTQVEEDNYSITLSNGYEISIDEKTYDTIEVGDKIIITEIKTIEKETGEVTDINYKYGYEGEIDERN